MVYITFRKVRNKSLIFLLAIVFLFSTLISVIPVPVKAAADDPVVTEETSLPMDETQAAQVEQLGLSSEQPSRVSPSGKEIDKNANPLGPNTLVLNRTFQLGLTYQSAGQDKTMVYTNPIGKIKIDRFLNSVASGYSTTSNTFNVFNKVVVPVDIDGNGKQETATIGITLGRNGYKLQLFINDYNTLVNTSKVNVPTSSSIYTIADLGNDSGNFTYNNTSLKGTSGDINHDGIDEIVISTGNRVYICKANMSSSQILSSKTDYVAKISDIKALDSNGDGFPELLVTQDPSGFRDGTHLIIYKEADLSKEAFNLKLSVTGNYFFNASVDMGNLLGDGDKTIVIGGFTSLGAGISYIKYHPETESYDTVLPKIYTMITDSETSFKAVKGTYDIKCVSLATPVPGTPEYVTMGGYLFKYDPLNDIFNRIAITTSTEDSDDVSTNKANVAEDNITNVNHDKDETNILQVLTGNFDGNAEGKEQIILLHYNKWYKKEIVYITQCYMNSDGTITANLEQMWKKEDDNAYIFPNICAVDVVNHGTKLEFEPDKSSFVYSNPVITAVLGASPFYKEFENDYTFLGNVETNYGSGTEEESSESNGVTANVGVSFGFEQGFGVFGVELFRLSFEVEVNNSFAWSWSNSKSISKNISYTNYNSNDAVVLTIIPYDVYVYKATAWNSKTQKYETGEIVMNVPYSPLTTIMTIDDYNKAAKNIPNAPIVGSDVLDHTVGDPRTYPRTSAGLSNVSGMDVLMAASDEASSFTGSGIGDSSIEQSITTSDTTGKSFDYALSVDTSFNVNVGGVTVGASIGVGYTHNATISSTQSTTRSGSVASVPSTYSQYQFSWALVAYNYDLTAGSAKQRCTVVNYICKPVGSEYPPKVPANFKVSSQDLTQNSLRWDIAGGASGYNVLRSTSENGTYSVIATLSGLNTNVYSDTTIEKNQAYYYMIRSFNSKLAIPTEAIKVPNLYVTDIKVSTQPKLSYNEYDTLDLSAFIVSLVLSNSTTKQVAYADFEKYDLTTSMKNGIELEAANTGTPITVKYTVANISANTNNLTIKANSIYPIAITVKFTVGSTANAAVLAPNVALSANVSMENTTAVSKQAMVILALYNEKGTMVQYSAQTKTIAANSTATCTNKVNLPSTINGYTAKVFLWDGTSLLTSNLTPLSDVIQIPKS